jgi:transposase
MRQELLDHPHRPAQVNLDLARHVVQVAVLIEVQVAHDAGIVDDALPRAKAMLGDKGYDADRFRNALIKRGTVPCIPSKANRKIPIAHDQMLYRQRHKIENMFDNSPRAFPTNSACRNLMPAPLKDWRRIHTRYDRCARTFLSAICIAATIIFWINQ